MKRLSRIITVLFLAVVILIPFSTVRADVAPPPPPSGANIPPGDEQTQVRMVYEKVVIEVAAQSAEPTGQASVTASFVMRNLGTTSEKMAVRFPLCSGYSGEDQIGCMQYRPIQNFRVKVDGMPLAVTNTYEKLYLPDNSLVNIPTWANFPAVFPPGKDVNIEVQYAQVGYERSGPAYVDFIYILATGAGWQDTIGTADIIFRLPMKVDDTTVYSYQPSTQDLESPNSVVFVDNEIRWHLENFEPFDQTDDVSVSILRPEVWQKIQTEKKNVQLNPNDGEAWGRLGKAYKTAIIMGKGYIRQGKLGEQLYWESVQAYQKAVELLPNDADWHYGYADLLSANLLFNQFLKDGENEQTLLIQTVQQLKQALDINPNHKNARELLNTIAKPGVVDLTGPQPDYLILTPQAPTLTSLPTFTATPVTPTAIATKLPSVTSTPSPSPIPTNTASPVPKGTSTQAMPTQVAENPGNSGLWAAAIIPVVLGLLIIVVLRIRK